VHVDQFIFMIKCRRILRIMRNASDKICRENKKKNNNNNNNHVHEGLGVFPVP